MDKKLVVGMLFTGFISISFSVAAMDSSDDDDGWVVLRDDSDDGKATLKKIPQNFQLKQMGIDGNYHQIDEKKGNDSSLENSMVILHKSINLSEFIDQESAGKILQDLKNIQDCSQRYFEYDVLEMNPVQKKENNDQDKKIDDCSPKMHIKGLDNMQTVVGCKHKWHGSLDGVFNVLKPFKNKNIDKPEAVVNKAPQVTKILSESIALYNQGFDPEDYKKMVNLTVKTSRYRMTKNRPMVVIAFFINLTRLTRQVVVLFYERSISMVKKLVLVSLLSVVSLGLCAETQQDEITPLLQQVDLVLFILQKNTVRMERYGLDELLPNMVASKDSNIVISKKQSKEHSVFKIAMTEEKSKARDMQWDLSSDSRVKIIAGAKRTPKTYYLLLKKVVNPEICLEDCTKICFDCAVNRAQTEAQDGMQPAKPEWISTIEIVVPQGDEKVALQLAFEGKIDAACGLFVQNGLFQGQMPVVGKLKREEALAQGILVTKDALKHHGEHASEPTSTTSTEQQPASTTTQVQASTTQSSTSQANTIDVVQTATTVASTGHHGHSGTGATTSTLTSAEQAEIATAETSFITSMLNGLVGVTTSIFQKIAGVCGAH